MLDELKQAKTVVGIKQLRRALKDGRAKTVYVSQDADPRLTDPIVEACEAGGIACIAVPTMQELGRACGIEVGAAAAAVLH